MEELTKEEKANGINSERNWLLRNEGVKHVPEDERKSERGEDCKSMVIETCKVVIG